LERAAQTFPESAPSKMNLRALTRARILLEAGRPEAAAREVRQAARPGLSLDDRVVAAGLLTAAQKIHRAQRAVANGYAEHLARGPVPGREALWWYAWPRSFMTAEWTPLAARVPEGLALAVMREESGYRPKVVSPVGARGLMQIMPETGRRLADAVGRDGFHPDDLFNPGVNVALGRHYLGQLLDQFDGRASAAIASYNAGPEVVSRWLRERGDWPDDRWVEAIPYSETRGYVRRVLRSLHIYRVLYGEGVGPAAPPSSGTAAALLSSSRNP
jgi:soluble lytic murein transglycosylase